MTLYQPLTKQQTEQLKSFLKSDSVDEGCLDFTAAHGFLTGMAAGPESLVECNWMEFLFDGQPDYASEQEKLTIEALLEQQANLIQRSLYLGEELEIPCQLTASAPGETNDLSDWCFGFIEAIAIDEDSWFPNDEMTEAVAELILPMSLLSDQFDDPELEHLTSNKGERQKLANSLVDNIQNLYLLFRE